MRVLKHSCFTLASRPLVSRPPFKARKKISVSQIVCAKSGFGKQVEEKPSGTSSSSNKSKGKKGGKQKKRQIKQSNPMAPSQPQPNSREQLFMQRLEQQASGTGDDQEAFEKRLAALRKQGEASQSERAKSNSSSEGGILAAGPLSSPPEKARPERQKKDDSENSGFGVPQVVIGALSLGLVAVFVVTSGFGPGGGSPPDPTQGLTQEQRQDLQKRAGELDAILKEKPNDVDALKESADLSAVLGDLKKSSGLAERITKAEPTDAKAWLALADARGRIGDYRGAEKAYEKSIEASGVPSLPQLQGLATSLVSDKRPSEAIQRLQGTESQAGREGAVGVVELKLLIGKVYSQWDRHFASSLAVYDGLIEQFPDDFRGYLARGALLKENGRKGDAQRMFIQARFLAPPEARAVVDAVAER